MRNTSARESVRANANACARAHTHAPRSATQRAVAKQPSTHNQLQSSCKAPSTYNHNHPKNLIHNLILTLTLTLTLIYTHTHTHTHTPKNAAQRAVAQA